MERASHVLSPLLNRLGLTAGVRLGRIRNEWDALFGPTLSAHMSASKLSEGELLVNIDQPIWMQQLTFHKRQIIEKLRPYGVREVRFRIGRIYRPKTPGPAVREPAVLSTEDSEFIEALVSDVADQNLRQAIRSAAERSIKSRPRTGRNVS